MPLGEGVSGGLTAHTSQHWALVTLSTLSSKPHVPHSFSVTRNLPDKTELSEICTGSFYKYIFRFSCLSSWKHFTLASWLFPSRLCFSGSECPETLCTLCFVVIVCFVSIALLSLSTQRPQMWNSLHVCHCEFPKHEEGSNSLNFPPDVCPVGRFRSALVPAGSTAGSTWYQVLHLQVRILDRRVTGPLRPFWK